MNARNYLMSLKDKFGPCFNNAVEAAIEKYGDVERAFYSEGEYAWNESQKELSTMLTDKAEQVSSELEEVFRAEWSKENDEEFGKRIKYVDEIYYVVVASLEELVPHDFMKELAE